MPRKLIESDLEAYLDEALPSAEMADIEDALRRDEALSFKLVAINARRDSGIHSLGEIWRRHRLTCPSREQLGGHLLGVLADDLSRYIIFHLETIGCRYCQANLDDLRQQQADESGTAATRRRKYFQSSAGYLDRQEEK